MNKQTIPPYDASGAEDGGIHVEWFSGQLRKCRIPLIVNGANELTRVISLKPRTYPPTPRCVTL